MNWAKFASALALSAAKNVQEGQEAESLLDQRFFQVISIIETDVAAAIVEGLKDDDAET